MWLRMRQIAGVTSDMKKTEKEIMDVLGVKVGYRDPHIGAAFGLENALFPIGNQLLEVVAPIRDSTAGGRYLNRRGGDGGYMIITQCDDHAPRRALVDKLGIRIVSGGTSDEYISMQLHPKDTGGTFFEIDQQLGDRALEVDGPWWPAGPNWQDAKSTERVQGFAAAEVQCDDPEAVARRWSEIAAIDLNLSNGAFQLPLEDGDIRFVACQDNRPEGLGGIDLLCSAPQKVLDAAEARGVRSGDRQVMLCGMRMNLVTGRSE